MPDLQTEYSKDGTEAHELLDYALSNRIRSAKAAYKDCLLTISWTVDEDALADRLAAVQEALDYVYALLDLWDDAILANEAVVDVPSNAAPGQRGGTTDIRILVPSMSLLYVLDYKHGAGVSVEVVGNEQALDYGLGSALEFEAAGYTIEHVALVIIQPRVWHPAGYIRAWDVSREYLTEWHAIGERVIAECEAPDAPFTPGEKQCQFCAKAVCPAYEQMALTASQGVFKTFREMPELPDPKTLDVARLAAIYANRKPIEAFLSSVEDCIKSLVLSGTYVPGAKVVEVNAKRRYEGDAEAVAAKLIELTGKDWDDVYPRKLIGIGDAEKMVVKAYRERSGLKGDAAAQAGKEAMAWLTTKSSSGNLTLVDETDPRPAVNRAERDFANVQVIDVKD